MGFGFKGVLRLWFVCLDYRFFFGILRGGFCIF